MCLYLVDNGFENIPTKFKIKYERVMGERMDTGLAAVTTPMPGVALWLYPDVTFRIIYRVESLVYRGVLQVATTVHRKVISPIIY